MNICHSYFRPLFGSAEGFYGRVACLRCYAESSWVSGPVAELSPEKIAARKWGIDNGHDLCHYNQPSDARSS